MRDVRLRPVRADDLVQLAANSSKETDSWNFFGFRASNALERGFGADGFVSDNAGMLAVEGDGGVLVGDVGWHAVQHGPSSACRAMNMGIALLPEHRGQGYGSAAQAALVDYLFQNTLLERVEASTDVENIAEQRALEKAGFVREGVLRHAQFRAGQWRDLVLYSRLRGDAKPPEARPV